jgi:Amt family ammonium transporter
MIEYLTSDPKGSPVSVGGLAYGQGFAQLSHQALAALVIIVFDAIMTFIVLKIIGFIVPLRSSDLEIEGGDLAIHGMDPMPIVFPPGKIPTAGGAPAS